MKISKFKCDWCDAAGEIRTETSSPSHAYPPEGWGSIKLNLCEGIGVGNVNSTAFFDLCKDCFKSFKEKLKRP